MDTIRTDSPTSITIRDKAIPGAEDRQKKIPGFDQEIFSRSRVLCIGAGGLISHVAPALVRKGIGALTILDDDVVEVSNLNRQRFYEQDIGKYKAIALVQNLQNECIRQTQLIGHALRFEEAIRAGVDLNCDLAVCGVDNNTATVETSRYFRKHQTFVIFTAVSTDADHGYVFIQEPAGPCYGCLFPDSVNDGFFPCPETPALVDILQAVGALVTYGVDSCLMGRHRSWNYRQAYLSNASWSACKMLSKRPECPLEPF